MNKKNLIFTLDAYKDLHAEMLPDGTKKVYSYLESRQGAMYPYCIFFGLQYFLKEWFEGEVITKADIDEAEPAIKASLEMSGDIWDRSKWDYIVEKHGGRLPVEIRAVKEGTKVSTGNVLITVANTDDECAWLTNGLETLLQNIWYAITVATRSHYINDIIKGYFKAYVDEDVAWLSKYYLWDFGQRAVSCPEQGGIGAMAHLINGEGSDSKLAIPYAVNYYNADYKTLYSSCPASEHSIMTALGEEGEFDTVRNLIKKFPKGILSIVSDSYDIERAVKYYCKELKDEILNRSGKFVVRPDSPRFEDDTPEAQVLWIVQTLWDSFGGTTNKKGLKILDSHVGVLYGDSLTEIDIENILSLLKNKGFSPENCVFGCGGYLLQRLNRDTQKMAFKSSAQYRNEKWHDVSKNPLDKSKVSKAGRFKLIESPDVSLYPTHKTLTVNKFVNVENNQEDCLELVFLNGEIKREQTFAEIRELAAK